MLPRKLRPSVSVSRQRNMLLSLRESRLTLRRSQPRKPRPNAFVRRSKRKNVSWKKPDSRPSDSARRNKSMRLLWRQPSSRRRSVQPKRQSSSGNALRPRQRRSADGRKKRRPSSRLKRLNASPQRRPKPSDS